MSRIKGEKLALNPQAVESFFTERAKRFNPEHPLTAVLYQDKNPALAEKRDAYEKNFALPLLKLTGTENILDIGCGIGRWASLIHPHVKLYNGMDFSAGLIDIARKQLQKPNVHFHVAGAEDLHFDSVMQFAPYNRMLIAGLMIYLNDDQIVKLLKGMLTNADNDCLVYLREPLALDTRLTLNEFWSDELTSSYSAIYRTEAELRVLIDSVLSGHVASYEFLPLYADDHLNNRAETKQFYSLLRIQKVS